MRSIFKYPLNDEGWIGVPSDAKPIHYAVDPKTHQISIWCEVPNAEQTKMMTRRYFCVVATGRDQLNLDTKSLRLEHRATIVEPTGYVWHVYEKITVN